MQPPISVDRQGIAQRYPERGAYARQALMEMNLQLHYVISDITGATGMRIIRAIVAGERDPDVLASFRDGRCHLSVATIRATLVGNDRDEHIFALTQSLELYDTYQAKMAGCDRKLEAVVAVLTVKASGPVTPLPKARMKGKQANAPSFDVRAALYGVLGVDLTKYTASDRHWHSSWSPSVAPT